MYGDTLGVIGTVAIISFSFLFSKLILTDASYSVDKKDTGWIADRQHLLLTQCRMGVLTQAMLHIYCNRIILISTAIKAGDALRIETFSVR